MRTTLRGKLTLLFMTCAVLLAIPAIAAIADTLTVNDVVAGGDVTKVSGESGQAGVVIAASNTDPVGDANGCNATGASGGATLTLTSSDASKVNFGGNASTSKTVSGCGTTSTFNYQVPTSATAGTATITATATGGKDGSKYTPDSFTVTVIEPTPTDTTGPVITPHVDGTLGNNDWYKSDVVVTWDVVDDESEVTSTSGCDPTTISSDTDGTTLTCEATSAGGTSRESVTVKRDATAPTDIAFVGGGLTDGASYDFNSVPDGPTSCTADGAISGLKGCGLSGYGTGVGSHTVTATAEDNAGNTATSTLSYTVAAATAKGFYSPIDMNNAVNTVKGGSTVPAKFELFGGASNTEQKNLSAVSSMSAKQINCASLTGAPDAIEEIVSTNATGLRFDTTGDQFIYNWKTPKSPGTCYSLTMTAADQQTKLVAYFQLK